MIQDERADKPQRKAHEGALVGASQQSYRYDSQRDAAQEPDPRHPLSIADLLQGLAISIDDLTILL
jgi:hypothetical protein